MPRFRKTVANYVDSLTKENLHDRAITRDLDWGIDVPIAEAKGKKLYVWFDAPIGYVSNTKQWIKETGKVITISMIGGIIGIHILSTLLEKIILFFIVLFFQ